MPDQEIILSGVLRGTFSSGSMKSNANATNGHLLKGVPKLWQWQSEGTDYDGTTLECITDFSYQLLSLQFPGENTKKKAKVPVYGVVDLTLPSGPHTVRKAESHL